MKVIYGSARSGKSTTALNQIDLRKKTLYFCLDFDKRIKQLEFFNPNLEVVAFPKKQTFPVTLESYIHTNGGGILNNTYDYVVIDPINFLKFRKDIYTVLRDFLVMETIYDSFELIVTMNIPERLKLNPNFLKINDKIEFIESEIKVF